MPSGEEIQLTKEEMAAEKAKPMIDSTSDERIKNNVMRHEYRVLSDLEKQQMKHIKNTGAMFLALVDSFGSKREYSIAKTKIEEAVMWAVKGITG